ncbi:hypothetical protein GCM10025860_13940 [Methanobacterium ferruginis]|nr:hypothetical protein GCM10025860_13940 [Methanobacterium ferruginis]
MTSIQESLLHQENKFIDNLNKFPTLAEEILKNLSRDQDPGVRNSAVLAAEHNSIFI